MTIALLVIDVQKNMVVGKYAVPNAENFLRKFEIRITDARSAGQPVIWVQNDGPEGDIDEPFSEGWELYFTPADGERVVRKTTQNVFESSPDLAAVLKAQSIDSVELIGMQSEYCVQASARGAKAAGFEVTLKADLHATFHDGTPATNFSDTFDVSAPDLAKRVRDQLLADQIISE